jgi:hypothetical protein
MSNGNELVVRETGEVVPITDTPFRNPSQVLEEAGKAAKALQDVISKKSKKVVFNNEQYLEFEDWQTLARFYGYSVGVEKTAQAIFGDSIGFEATAVVYDKAGSAISRADAMCMNDEPNWKSKPAFQLRSMAQTRACAKALRQVLAWVAVLAGYRPTPAEEMTVDTVVNRVHNPTENRDDSQPSSQPVGTGREMQS